MSGDEHLSISKSGDSNELSILEVIWDSFGPIFNNREPEPKNVQSNYGFMDGCFDLIVIGGC